MPRPTPRRRPTSNDRRAGRDRAAAADRRPSGGEGGRLGLPAVAVGVILAVLAGVAAVRALMPEPPASLRARAEAQAEARHWDEALDAWRALNATPAADARSLLGEARACLALHLAARAEAALERACAADPSEPEPWLVRLEILRLEDRQAEAAEVGWRAYRAVPAAARAAVLRALTLALLADVPDELARETLSRWIEADSGDLDARAALDRRRHEHPRGDDPAPDARIAALEAALARRPDHAGLREALVLGLAEAGRPDRGRELLDAWPGDRRDARYDRLRGRWDLEYDARYDDAIAAFGRVLDLLPHDWKTTYRLSRALQRAGREAEAKAAAERMDRLREALEPGRLGPRLDADLARPGDPAARLDLAALCDSAGLTRLAEAWRREATGTQTPR